MNCIKRSRHFFLCQPYLIKSWEIVASNRAYPISHEYGNLHARMQLYIPTHLYNVDIQLRYFNHYQSVDNILCTYAIKALISELAISFSRSLAPPTSVPLTNTMGNVGQPVHIFNALRWRHWLR